MDQRGLRIDTLEGTQMRSTVRARLLDEQAPPTFIGRYAIAGRIGTGGMGVVYAARDVELDRDVAVKLVHRTSAASSSAQELLLREARALAQLAHPNVVAIYDVGLHGDRVFIAMERVHGVTLRVHARDRCRGWRDRLAIYLQAGEGLAAAHAAGLVHRDFKPDNAIVGDDGRVRVLDFGLAHSGAVVDDASPETRAPTSATIAGTLAYMAPEQRAGGSTDARADQFAFCVALWEALHGRHPFGGDVPGVKHHAGNTVPTAPRGHGVPSWLRAVLRRGLADDPGARWPSMAQLLRVCAEGPPRRRTWGVALVVASLVVGGVATATLLEHASTVDCETLAPDLAAVWNPSVADSTRAAFVATGGAYGPTAAQKLDAILARWRDSFVEAQAASCRAHTVAHTLDDAKWSLRRQCFETQAQRFVDLVDTLAQPERAMIHASVRAASLLPTIDVCTDDLRLAARAALAGDDVPRELASDIRHRLARGHQLHDMGDAQRAREILEAARSEALATGNPQLEGEARLAWAMSLAGRGAWAEAAAEDELAYFAALRARDDDTAVRAAILGVMVHGCNLARHDDGEQWAHYAHGGLDRIAPASPELEARLARAEAELHRCTGDGEIALALHRRAVALHREALGSDHALVGEALVELGGVLAEGGELDAARTAMIDAERILVATYGGGAPVLADPFQTRCAIEGMAEDYDAAVPYCERTLALREQQLGPDHPAVASALVNLAGLAMHLDDEPRARELLLRALAIRRAKLAPRHPLLASVLASLGTLELRGGEPATALGHFEEARASLLEHKPDAHLKIAELARSIANAHAAMLGPSIARRSPRDD